MLEGLCYYVRIEYTKLPACYCTLLKYITCRQATGNTIDFCDVADGCDMDTMCSKNHCSFDHGLSLSQRKIVALTIVTNIAIPSSQNEHHTVWTSEQDHLQHQNGARPLRETGIPPYIDLSTL